VIDFTALRRLNSMTSPRLPGLDSIEATAHAL